MLQKNHVIILKSFTIFTLSFLLLINNLFSQKKYKSTTETPFHKGSNSIGLGVGIGIDYDYYGDITSPPAFFLSYDRGIINDLGPGNLGVGGILAIKTASYKYASGGYKATWKNYIIGLRATYHLTILTEKNNKFDPYGGVMAGLRINTYKDTYSPNSNAINENTLYPVIGAFVGAKYNFAKNFGAFVEGGYDFSFLRGGINVNF